MHHKTPARLTPTLQLGRSHLVAAGILALVVGLRGLLTGGRLALHGVEGAVDLPRLSPEVSLKVVVQHADGGGDGRLPSVLVDVHGVECGNGELAAHWARVRQTLEEGAKLPRDVAEVDGRRGHETVALANAYEQVMDAVAHNAASVVLGQLAAEAAAAVLEVEIAEVDFSTSASGAYSCTPR